MQVERCIVILAHMGNLTAILARMEDLTSRLVLNSAMSSPFRTLQKAFGDGVAGGGRPCILLRYNRGEYL